MPRKRQSQPMQVWLSDKDRQRLRALATKTGCTKSFLAREAIRLMLDESENRLQERNAIADAGVQFDDFDTAGKNAIARADDQAFRLGHNKIGTEHLLLGVVMDPTLSAKLAKYALTPAVIRNKILIFLGFGRDTVFEHLSLTDRCKRVLLRARKLQAERRDRFVSVEHLMLALLAQGSGGAYHILHLVAPDVEPICDDIRKVLPVRPVKARSRKTPE